MADVWLLATRTVQRIEDSMREDLAKSPAAGLSACACHVLKALYEQDGQRPSDLAKVAGRAPTSFTPVLDTLEEYNFIRRKNSAVDRRSVLIYLTKDAEIIRANVLNAIADAETKFGKG